jgi:hypothetical protein
VTYIEAKSKDAKMWRRSWDPNLYVQFIYNNYFILHYRSRSILTYFPSDEDLNATDWETTNATT